MSSIPQNHSDEKALIDCVQRFFSKHHVGKLLARCNGMKEKGVSPVSLLRYKLSNIFVGRSMYMQQRTGSFKEDFSKNTFYRFLNSAKTNWFRFTSLLAADIVNNDIRDLTNQERKNVFISLIRDLSQRTVRFFVWITACWPAYKTVVGDHIIRHARIFTNPELVFVHGSTLPCLYKAKAPFSAASVTLPAFVPVP